MTRIPYDPRPLGHRDDPDFDDFEWLDELPNPDLDAPDRSPQNYVPPGGDR